MDRYQSNDTKTLPNGTVIYKPALTTDIVTDLNDPVIITGDADRLDVLAFKHYGDAQLWWVIAKANQLVIGNLHVPAGTQLTIPAKNKIV